MTLAAEVLAHGGSWGAGGWWPIFPILWLAFFALLFFGVFRALRSRAGWHRGPSGENVLGERYARGEIEEDEYRHRLEVLRSGRP